MSSSNSELTAEEIRNRRLRRLGVPAPSSVATTEAPVEASTAPPSKAGDDSTNANSVVSDVTVDNNKNHHQQQHELLRLQPPSDKASGSKRKSSDLDQCPDSSKTSNSIAPKFLPGGSNSTIKGSVAANNNNQDDDEQRGEGEEVIIEQPPVIAVVQQMETDDCLDNDNIPDSDSGIENMETEESQEVPPQLNPNKNIGIGKIKLPPPTLRQDIEIRVARVLNANWGRSFGSFGGQITVEDVDLADEFADLWLAEDFVSRIISEIIALYYDGVLTKSSSTQDMFADSSSASSSASASPTGVGSAAATSKKPPAVVPEGASTSAPASNLEDDSMSCPRPTLISFSLPRVAALDYLIRCYDLCRIELDELERMEVSGRGGHARTIIDLFHKIRLQLIDYSLLILDGTIAPKVDPNNEYPLERSPLLQLLYENSVDGGFLQQLVAESHKRPPIFVRVFKPLLRDLYRDQQIAIVSRNMNTQPLRKLHELVEIVIEGSVRPIASLVTSLRNFHPVLCTPFPGRELAKVSYLGPFLSLSIFLQENPKFAERNIEAIAEHGGNRPVQMELECMRVSLHQMVHGLLKNVASRGAVLTYLGAVLSHNEKRTQIQADEGHSARDGFMLNVLVLLQKLSQKIKLDRVDQFYPFRSNAIVAIVKDTKVRLTSDEYNEWLAGDEFNAATGGGSAAVAEANFQTQCWFLTLHAHHISIMPAVQRYGRRLRAIKEFQRLVNELNAIKAQWEFSQYAARNKQMQTKWTQQIKKLTLLKQCYDIGLMDPQLVRGCMQFYSTVCDYLLHHMEGRAVKAGVPFITTIPPPQLKPLPAFSALPEW